MHVLLKHMILNVQTAQLLHVHELMQEAQISEYQARAVLIAREEEWVTWRQSSHLPQPFDASLRVPGAAPPSFLAPPPHMGGVGAGGAVSGSGAQVPAAAAPGSTAVAALHPPGPVASGGNTRPVEEQKRPKRVYDMDFMLQCRLSSSAAPNAERVQGQVKAIIGCVDATQSLAVAGDRLASPAIATIRFGTEIPTVHFGGGTHGGTRTRPVDNLGDVEPLVRSENAFDARIHRAKTSSDVVLKEARSILNKLTMTNFDRLAQQLSALNISAPVELAKLVAIIFDKALEEGHFCNMYAKLCHSVKDKLPEFTSEPEQGEGRGGEGGGHGEEGNVQTLSAQ